MKQSLDLPNGTRITVEYQLQAFTGQIPYFSITGHVTGRDGSWLTGGCIHDEIEAAFPGVFSDLIALHLSNVYGMPMHAESNGWYFFNGGSGGHDSLQKHLRIDAAELQKLVADLYGLPEGGPRRMAFHDCVESMRPRWRQEADAAISRHALNVTA